MIKQDQLKLKVQEKIMEKHKLVAKVVAIRKETMDMETLNKP